MIKEFLGVVGIASMLLGGAAQAQSTLWKTAPGAGAAQAGENPWAGVNPAETRALAASRDAGERQIALRPQYELYYAPVAGADRPAVSTGRELETRRLALRPQYELYYAPSGSVTAPDKARRLALNTAE